jgi:hypothetical protein
MMRLRLIFVFAAAVGAVRAADIAPAEFKAQIAPSQKERRHTLAQSFV